MIEGQIEDQNKVALAYFANRTHDTIEADKGISLRHFITRTKDTAQNAIKKSSVSQKENADDKIEGISEVHFLSYFNSNISFLLHYFPFPVLFSSPSIIPFNPLIFCLFKNKQYHVLL